VPLDPPAAAEGSARPSEDGTTAGSAGATGAGTPASKPAKKLVPRAVSTLEGALFAKQHNLLYVETSAKEGWGVVDAFEWTARQILERVERGEFERRKPAAAVNLKEQKAKGGCC
jgi:Ras-related protein Rab-2A/Rab family protein